MLIIQANQTSWTALLTMALAPLPHISNVQLLDTGEVILWAHKKLPAICRSYLRSRNNFLADSNQIGIFWYIVVKLTNNNLDKIGSEILYLFHEYGHMQKRLYLTLHKRQCSAGSKFSCQHRTGQLNNILRWHKLQDLHEGTNFLMSKANNRINNFYLSLNKYSTTDTNFSISCIKILSLVHSAIRPNLRAKLQGLIKLNYEYFETKSSK